MIVETKNSENKIKTREPYIWSIHFAFWVVIISFVAYFAALSFNGLYMLQRSLVLVAGNIILFYASYSWIFPDFILKKRVISGLFLLLGIILLVIATRLYGDIYLMDKFDRAPEFSLTFRRRFLLMLLGETGFAGLAGLIRMTVSVYENNKRINEMKNLQLSTELLFLKAQMSPHFLFNSINNIYSLVLLKSDKAPEALMRLSELLRYSLYDCHNKVQLDQEIEALKSYIDLFKLRYEEDIQLTLNNRLENMQIAIEPLLFVPLVENACKYSGVGMSPDAYIDIQLFEETTYVCISVTNSIGTFNIVQSASGIGLTNIQKRLDTLYPDKYVLEINQNEETYQVTLKLELL